MIIGSILFVLVAVGLFVAGLTQGESAYYYLSIGACAIAALALLTGVQHGGRRRDEDEADVRPISTEAPPSAVGHAAVPRQPYAAAAEAPTAAERPGEPRPEALTQGDMARLALLAAEVAVIDGRPRYHLVDCPHLLGHDHERLPVKEAVGLGFTPCGACAPGAALLARGRS